MKSRLHLMATLAASLVLSQPLAAETITLPPDYKGEIRRIRTVGEDGNETYYRVECKDKTWGQVTVHADPVQTCAKATYKPQRCLASWRLQDAAEHACR